MGVRGKYIFLQSIVQCELCSMAKEDWDELAVVRNREGLGVKVSDVKNTRGVMNGKHLLGDTVTYPIESHVNRF